MRKTIVLGTLNPSKLEEMQSYFTGTPFHALSPKDITASVPDIPESADTIRGNAILKAKAWQQITGLPVIAEDSGLLFMDLAPEDPDQPGQFVRRFHGRKMTDEEMLEHYIDIIHRHGGQLRACWVNCWCLLEDARHGETHENSSVPFLLRENASPLRHAGWPLDSISWLLRCIRQVSCGMHRRRSCIQKHERRLYGTVSCMDSERYRASFARSSSVSHGIKGRLFLAKEALSYAF